MDVKDKAIDRTLVNKTQSVGKKTSIDDHFKVETLLNQADSMDISAKGPRRRIIKTIVSQKELNMQEMQSQGRFI